jgi:hypothetical protein
VLAGVFPVLVALSRFHILTFLFHPFMVWLSCPGSPFLALVFSLFFSFSVFVLHIMFFVSCPRCSVLPVLSWLSCPGCLYSKQELSGTLWTETLRI